MSGTLTDKQIALNAAAMGIFRPICPLAFVSGSRAFGWDTGESDFDICVRMEDKDKAFAAVKNLSNEYEESRYYNSAKAGGVMLRAYWEGQGHDVVATINPIPLHPLDMLCWWLATQELQRVARIDASRIGDRAHKHGAFELLRGFYKSMIEYKGAEWAEAVLRNEQVLFVKDHPYTHRGLC